MARLLPMPDVNVAQTDNPIPRFWLLEETGRSGLKYLRSLMRDSTLGLQNSSTVESAEIRLAEKSKILSSDDIPLPPRFPKLTLILPEKRFAPDFFTQADYQFCSEKLRNLLDQPEHVVQFVPINFFAGGDEARAKNYTCMRVIANQPAVDIYRSDCDVAEFINPITGERSANPRFPNRFALLEGLEARTEVFRIDESSTRILVTDAVAERVVRGRCTGIEFADPEDLQYTDKPKRYRGPKGVVER
ncbi:imm11 family protein [Acidisoma cladoniae]|uniref:imm11 family protein n=1 Tax=Acidisoma cladoniae TaxID=3040935 RepID=UPI00255004B8|nr:DUF1629 domain-containing protein [Acidisoma sp. PAMC 29798]